MAGLGLHRIFALEAWAKNEGAMLLKHLWRKRSAGKTHNTASLSRHSAAALLLFAIERRFLLPTLRGHLAVAPPRDAQYLTLALWSTLAGGFARALRIEATKFRPSHCREARPSRPSCSDI